MNIDKIKDHIEDVMRDVKNIMDDYTFLWIKPNKYDEYDELKCTAHLIKRLSYLVSTSETLIDQLSVARDELMFILHKEMDDQKIVCIESDELTVKIKKNPPKLLIHDEKLISADYYYNKQILDKALLLKDIKEGLEVQGCELIQDHRVDIKYKPVKAKECV